MCLIVELAPKEVGWLGTAERMPSGNFYIDEIFVPEQEVTGTETDPTDEGQFKIMNELAEMGEEGMQKIEKLRFWGHSHVHMMTSPSGTDENTPLNYQRLGLPWFIRGIFNKLGRAEFTVYLFEEGYRFLDVPWVAVDSQTGENLTTERTRQSPVLFGSGDRDRREFAQERQGELRDGKPIGTTDDGVPKLDAPQPVVPPVKLHPKLIPGEAERKQVAAELKAKLKERFLGGFFGGWGGRNNDASRAGGAEDEARDLSHGSPGNDSRTLSSPGGEGQNRGVRRGITDDGIGRVVTTTRDFSSPPVDRKE
jgi:hypothetical protein